MSELHAHALASDVDFVGGGLLRAMNWMWYFVILGSSNIELKSNLALLWVGLLKAGWAVASGALFVALFQTAVRGWSMLKTDKKAIIVGWNERGPTVVSELSRSNVAAHLLSVQKIEGDECTKLEGRTTYSALRLRASTDQTDRGEPRFPDGSLQSEITTALHDGCQGIIVLGDHDQAGKEGEGDVDCWVARQLFAIRAARTAWETSLSASEKKALQKKPIRIVAEVEHQGNVEILRAAGADEAVCVRSFGTGLLAQTMSKPGLCDIFNDLAQTEAGTYEIYFQKLSAAQIADLRTFERVSRQLAGSEELKIPIGLLGTDPSTGKRTRRMNPRGEAARLRKGDELILIAQFEP